MRLILVAAAILIVSSLSRVTAADLDALPLMARTVIPLENFLCWGPTNVTCSQALAGKTRLHLNLTSATCFLDRVEKDSDSHQADTCVHWSCSFHGTVMGRTLMANNHIMPKNAKTIVFPPFDSLDAPRFRVFCGNEETDGKCILLLRDIDVTTASVHEALSFMSFLVSFFTVVLCMFCMCDEEEGTNPVLLVISLFFMFSFWSAAPACFANNLVTLPEGALEAWRGMC
jgi:hypothetical protein